jgi:hypothetical protein
VTCVQVKSTEVAFVLFALLACKSGIRDESTATGSKGPYDLQLSAVTRDLECDKATAGTPRGEACRVAKDFAKGTTPGPWPTSGREVWFGRTYRVVEGKPETSELYFMQVQPGHPPAIELSAEELKGQLNVEASARDLLPENPGEKTEAEALLTALKAGSAAPPSGALTYIRTAEPKNGFRAMSSTKGASVIIVSRYPYSIRAKDKRLLMIEPHEKGGGWFSELWKVPPG